MFTGLIEAVGEVADSKPLRGGARLRIVTPMGRELSVGDSVAVNGVCLTAIRTEPGEIHADVGPETLRVTTLGDLRAGAVVNLERPLRADGRLGGHFVQGHIDGVGSLETVRHDEDFHWMTIRFPSDLAPYIIHKGSIALDGISFTVAGLSADCFDVMVIPFTFDHTNLKHARVRDRVNLECDMVGKYVARAAELYNLSSTGIHPGDVDA